MGSFPAAIGFLGLLRQRRDRRGEVYTRFLAASKAYYRDAPWDDDYVRQGPFRDGVRLEALADQLFEVKAVGPTSAYEAARKTVDHLRAYRHWLGPRVRPRPLDFDGHGFVDLALASLEAELWHALQHPTGRSLRRRSERRRVTEQVIGGRFRYLREVPEWRRLCGGYTDIGWRPVPPAP